MFGGLFGGDDSSAKSKPEQEAPTPKPKAPPAEYHSPYKNAGFDPTALEAALKNANDLKGRKLNVNQVQKEMRETGTELKDKMKKYNLASKQLDQATRQRAAQEKRATLDMQIQEEQKREQFIDQLARQRKADEMKAEQFLKEEQLKMRQIMEQRQEEIRKRTAEYEAELRQRTELTTVQAQTSGSIRQERDNQGLLLQRRREAAKEHRTTVLEAIKLGGETVGRGVRQFLGDKDEVVAAVATVSALALGVYSARTATGVAGRFVEARLGRPALIRETSRMNAAQALRHPLVFARRALGWGRGDALEGVVLEPTLQARLARIAEATANTRRNRAPFRHVLLWGPPGTGKTMFAKGLARATGLEYAILTGGDVAPLGREAVTEVHKVFDWAHTARRGVLVFVDEADAFLQRRSDRPLSEDARNALNAFLYRTGEATDRFMLVYATNQPEQFDDAINDRIDEMVHFGLPARAERRRMIDHYLRKYLLGEGNRGQTPIRIADSFGDKEVELAADLTEGFSGREISKLAIAWQAAVYGSEAAEFTPELMRRTLEAHLDQKRKKNLWLDDVTKEVAYGFSAKSSKNEKGGGDTSNGKPIEVEARSSLQPNL